MFGGPRRSTTPPPGNSTRPQAGDAARISGNLTHVFVNGQSSDGLMIYFNGQPLMTGQLDSLSVEIVAPGERDNGTLTAILSYYETGANGTRTNKSFSLFPGTVELIADGKRLSITCAEEGVFDGLFLRFGTDNNGVGMEANGVQSLRLLITPELRDVRLVWIEDGREDILLS
jgi:hypothetical protein